MTAWRTLATTLLALALTTTTGEGHPTLGTARPSTEPISSEQADRPWRVTVVGDSLATGRGIGRENAYPARLRDIARHEGWNINVHTVAGNGWQSRRGLREVGTIIQQAPDIVVLALGSNDGLRRQDTAALEHNLTTIVDRLQETGVHVVLTGLEAHPRHGTQYGTAFRTVFQRLAASRQTPMVPFLLEGVALQPEMNQRDGLHPNETGALQIAYNVWPTLRQTMIDMTGR